MRDARARPEEEPAWNAGAAIDALPLPMLERLLDRALDFDPETRAALADFSGATVDLEILGAGTLRLRIEADRIRVEPPDECLDADVGIRGAPLSLLRFAFGRDREALILVDHVQLSGDIALATRLQQIAARIDIDIEEAFARWIGDVPAHEFMRAVRGLCGWAHDTGSALLADVSEFVRHEAEMTPLGEDVVRFTQHVDDLRDDVERLDARIVRLERRRARRR